MLHRLSGDLGGEAAAFVILVDDHQARGLVDRLEHCVAVEGLETPGVDDLDVDLALEPPGDRKAIVNLRAAGQQGDVAARALDVGAAERHEIFLGRHGPLERDRSDVPQEEDGIVVADRRFHQALGVIGRRRHAHLDPRMMDQRAVGQGRVLVGDPPAEAAGPDHDHRNREPAAVHEMELAGLQEDFRAGIVRKPSVHEVDHGPHAFERRAEGAAEHPRLRQRRVDDAGRPEFLAEASGVREGARLDADAQQVDAFVPLHFLAVGFLDRFEKRDFAHVGHGGRPRVLQAA